MLDIRTLVQRLGGGAALARQIGVTPGAISQWIADDRVPPQREVAVWRLAHAAGLDWAPPGADGLALVEKGAAA